MVQEVRKTKRKNAQKNTSASQKEQTLAKEEGKGGTQKENVNQKEDNNVEKSHKAVVS